MADRLRGQDGGAGIDVIVADFASATAGAPSLGILEHSVVPSALGGQGWSAQYLGDGRNG